MAQEITNTFSKGMNLDTPEIQFPNEAYTSALNATFVTQDGNEMILQNDMGNAEILYNNVKVKLNKGYVPIGIKEYGGILYIASYSKDSCELGTYPSPDYTSSESQQLSYTYHALMNLKDNSDIKEFNTPLLNFKSEVDIQVQPSYDGTVNLILTDGVNKPRLINSGFAVQENNTAKIIKHIGDNNTNIYYNTSETVFNNGIALQKQSQELPKINYVGQSSNGQLQVGGYVIYIKASDEDENTTDVIAESGIIPIFLGTDGDPRSVNGLCGNYRTNKAINLYVTNLDPSYSHIQVYYSVSTSNKNEAATTVCYKLPTLVPVSNCKANISITGYEQALEISESELNTQYFIIDKNQSTVISNNITFLGNIEGQQTDYETLVQCSYRVIPNLKETYLSNLTYTNAEGLNKCASTVSPSSYNSGGYYDTQNIYRFVGYHNEEIYRFGIVYIYSNGSKSQVFNTLGISDLTPYYRSDLHYFKNDLNQKVILDNNNLYITNIGGYQQYNVKGTCRIKGDYWDPNVIYSISFDVPNNVKNKLKELGIIGYFFVRQKRIPLRLCQAYTTPVFENAYIPAIKYGFSINSKFGIPKNTDGSYNTGGSSRTSSATNIVIEGVRTNFHSYLFESFFDASYSHRPDESFFININDRVLTTQIYPEIGEVKQSFNINGKEYNKYKMHQQYDQRLIYMLERGLVHTKRCSGYNENEGGLCINGDYFLNEARYATLPGIQPVQKLLQHGAYAGFCPEYEIDPSYYNTFFTGQELTIKVIANNLQLHRASSSNRVYYTNGITNDKGINNTRLYYKDSKLNTCTTSIKYLKAKIISVEDGVSLMGIQRNQSDNIRNQIYANYVAKDTVYFSSKIGDASNKWGFKEVGGERVYAFSPLFSPDLILTYDDQTNTGRLNATFEQLPSYNFSEGFSSSVRYPVILPWNYVFAPTNLVRGLYSPYLGIYISNDQLQDQLLDSAIINIYIPGFKEDNISEYRNVIMRSSDAYYTISDYTSINDTSNIECFRGDCYSSISTHRINRNFQDSANPSNDTIVCDYNFIHTKPDADSAPNYNYIYDTIDDDNWHCSLPVNTKKLEETITNIGDMNAVQLGSWITFPLSSTMNLSLRGEDRTYPTEKLQMGQYRSFYPLYGVNISGGGKIPDSQCYNKGYSISGGVKKYQNIDTNVYINQYYRNRIYYSNIDITSYFTNGARTIISTNYRDYDSKYGAIVKLIDQSSYLLCVMEHGVAAISVLPQALVSQGTAGNTYINTNNVLHEKLELLSADYGSVYKTSILTTPYYTYGIDTFAKKIWRIRGTSMEIISDDNINSFLNDHLNITNEELQQGTLMLKTHYNYNKYDVIFSFYNYNSDSNLNVLWSICYNEKLQTWTTFYSWIPEFSANIGNSFISFDHKINRNIIVKDITQTPNYFWKSGNTQSEIKSNEIKPCMWYGRQYPFEIEFVVAQSPENHKVFTDLRLLGNHAEPESFHYELSGNSYDFDKSIEYYRQERARELWHKAAELNGGTLSINKDNFTIQYNSNYKDFNYIHKPLWHYENEKVINDLNGFVKSTVPWNYYIKSKGSEDIENYYNLITNDSRNYSYLTGTELVYNKRENILKFLVHAKGVNIDGPGGVLRGNMRYIEDKWYIQINPIFYKEKNEIDWDKPPIVYDQIPKDINMTAVDKAVKELNLDVNKDFDCTDWGERKSMQLRDKYMKVRIRYSGKEKVLLQAVKTLYQMSYA